MGGLTGDGHNINLNGQDATVAFGGTSQTIDNININGTSNSYPTIAIGTGSGGATTVVIGPHATLMGVLNVYNYGGNSPTVGTLVNNGTINSSAIMFYNSNVVNNGAVEAASNSVVNIEAQVLTFTNNSTMTGSGGDISINAQNWTNAPGGSITANGGGLTLTNTWINAPGATISANNYSVLDLGGSWVNQGSITASNCTVDLGGTITPSSMGNLSISNSTVNVLGTLDLAGGTFMVPATTGQWNLDDATIMNGTIAFQGQAFHIVGPFTSTLKSVRISGTDLYLDGQGLVDVIGGITVDTHNINVDAGSAEIGFDGPTTFIDNLNFNIPIPSSFAFYAGGTNTTTGAILTLGQNVVATGWSSFGGVPNATIFNDGTINETYQTLGLESAKFVNNGTINVTNGTTLYISSNTQFTNKGIINFIRTSAFGTPSVTAANGFNTGGGTLMGSAYINGDLNLSPGASSVILGIGTMIQGSINDCLTVNGNINLGGNLLIDFTNGFQSSINSNETFTVMKNSFNNQTINGAFQNVANGDRVETADGYGSFLVNYGTGAYAREIVLSNFESTAEPWTNATGNSVWDTGVSANWSINSSPSVFHTGDVVTFNDSNNGGYNVTLNTVVTPGSVVVNNSSGDYTISGIGSIAGAGALFKFGTRTLTLSTPNSYAGGTNVSNGLLLIEPTSSTTSALPNGPLSIRGGTVQLADNVTTGNALDTSNVVITSLSIIGNGTLDIGNNRIIVDYSSPATDPIASIEQWIANGATGTPGPAIISSDIATDDALTGLSYGIGYADGADGIVAGLPSGEIEIMFTLLGDANLDGTVNAEDFTLFSEHLGQSGQTWDDGDFNYDGTVNAEDFTSFSANLGQTASLAAQAGILNSANAINLANVPEPACAGMMVIAGLGILRRRRRI